jgi:molybdate transport system substrate-binding protein
MRLLLLSLLILRFLVSNAAAEIRELPFITIYAPSSLTLPLTEIVRHYSATHDITINVAYESPAYLEGQVKEGNGANIFISDHNEWMAKLQRQGAVIGKPTPFLTNKLAVIASADNPLLAELSHNLPLRELLILISNRAIMVIGDPVNSPLGLYSKQSLQQLGLWKKFEPMVIHAANARIALHLIAQGKTVGIGYLSDATNNPEVKILATIPDNLHSPILYQAAIISEDDFSASNDFITFLQSPPAIEIFGRFGFQQYAE